MTIFFNLPDENCDSIFQENKTIDLKVAMVFAKRFCENIEQLSAPERALIPHALSCIHHKGDSFYIDINNKSVSEEEEKLCPLESQNNKHWRSSTQRLTFLIVQLFYSLSVGRLPPSELKFLPSKILCSLSENNMLLVKEFLSHGLSSTIPERYQSFDELSTAIDIILKRLAIQQTTRIVNTTQTKYKPSYRINLQLYNFQMTEEESIELCAPCCIKIGRKVNTENKKMLRQTKMGTFYEKTASEDNSREYYIVIDDNCISRSHTEIKIHKTLKKSSIEDLGSTHGTIVFTEKSCDPSLGVLLQKNRIHFIIPLEQHFQVGNTLVSISPQV